MNLKEKEAFTITEFCQLYSIGRTKAYEEIKSGRLQIRKIGKRTIITAEAAQEWLANLPSNY